MSAYETMETEGGGAASVTLHPPANVILKFLDDSQEEPFLWGFQTVGGFRAYLAMLLRFEKRLEDREAANV